MQKNSLKIVISLALIIILNLAVYAQQGRGRGRIRGAVKDEAGKPLEAVHIVAINLKYKTTFDGESNKKGKWAIGGLGTGYFKIIASKDGYEKADQTIKVSQFSKTNPLVEFILKKIQEISDNMPVIQDKKDFGLFDEGNQLFRDKKYVEALEKFQEFSEKDPSIHEIYINIGLCYKEMGEYDKAIAALNNILDRVKALKGSFEGDESAARAFTIIGEINIQQGNLSKANEHFMQALEIVPIHEALVFNIGEIYFIQGEIDKAIEYFKRAVQIKDDWARPYLKLGYTYMNKGNYQLAVENFKKYLELAPDSPQAETINNLIPRLKELIKK